MASMSLWMCTYVYWYLFIIITRLTKVCLVWVCVWQHARRKHTHSLKYNKPSSLTNFLFSVCLSEWSRQTFSYSIMVQIYSACSYACVCVCVYLASLCMTACCLLLSALFIFCVAYLPVSQKSTMLMFTLTPTGMCVCWGIDPCLCTWATGLHFPAHKPKYYKVFGFVNIQSAYFTLPPDKLPCCLAVCMWML